MWLQPTKPLGNFFFFERLWTIILVDFPAYFLPFLSNFLFISAWIRFLTPVVHKGQLCQSVFLWSCLWHVDYYSRVWQRYWWKGNGFQGLESFNRVKAWRPFWVSPQFPESQTVGTNKQSGISICLIAAGTQLKRWNVNWPIYKEKQRLFNRRT